MYVYTNLHSNGGDYTTGSKVILDRVPTSGNHMEVTDIPEDLVGYDYFTLKHDGVVYELGSTASDIRFSFNLLKDADIIVLSNVQMPSLESNSFEYEPTNALGRYMNSIGPEDKYYNVNILGKDASQINENFYMTNYSYCKDWVNVSSLPGYGDPSNVEDKKTVYNQYVANKPDASQFKIVGDCTNVIVPLYKFNYRYTKSYDAGTVDLSFPELKARQNTVLIIVKPRSPKPFEKFAKLPTLPITTDWPQVTPQMNTFTDYDAVKASLCSFSEAENYYGPKPDGINIYTTRTFLSGGAGVSLLNDVGMEMGFRLKVPEDGDYDFAVKYVAWDDGGAKRAVNIDGKKYILSLEQTESWGTEPGQWRAATTEVPIHLTKGAHVITIEPVSGSWNFDWLGFIKR